MSSTPSLSFLLHSLKRLTFRMKTESLMPARDFLLHGQPGCPVD
jgi:hypothetical protein